MDLEQIQKDAEEKIELFSLWMKMKYYENFKVMIQFNHF